MKASKVYSGAVSDRGTSICRLSRDYFLMDKPVLIDDLVVVRSWDRPDKCYLCKSWPFNNSFGVMNKSVICFDRFISFHSPLPKEKTRVGEELAVVYYGSSLNIIFPKFQKCAKIPVANEVLLCYIGEAKKNLYNSTEKLRIKALLNRLYVVRGCRIFHENLEGIPNGLEIVDVHVADNDLKHCRESLFPAQITKITRIQFVSPKSVAEKPFYAYTTSLPMHQFDKSSASNTSNSSGYRNKFICNKIEKNSVKNENIDYAKSCWKSLKSDKFEVVGNLAKLFECLVELIELPQAFPLSLSSVGITKLSRGILLYGPPGVGKSLLVREVARFLDVALFNLVASDMSFLTVSDAATHLQSIFARAEQIQHRAGAMSDCRDVIIFIDEIDTICGLGARGEDENYSKLLTAQLSVLMDETSAIVIGATNRPHTLDPVLRRHGRFDKEICVDLPSIDHRLHVLQNCVHAMIIDERAELLKRVADRTSGWSAADISALCREAFLHALGCARDKQPIVGIENFSVAFTKILPSSRRFWAVEVPQVAWSDVGGLDEVKNKLKMLLEWPYVYSEQFKKFNLMTPRGVLFHGPPGCSKTTLVRAMASSSKAFFINVSCAEIHSAFVGESEKIIRDLFTRARAAKPTIIFFDEIDAIVGSRNSNTACRAELLTQLLVEMDGIEVLSSSEPNDMVLVVAATNRLDHVDPALLRPGRFDHIIEVPAPDYQGRCEILRIFTKSIPLNASVDIEAIAGKTDGFTGADLEFLCKESALIALNENINCCEILPKHFDESLNQIRLRFSLQTKN